MPAFSTDNSASTSREPASNSHAPDNGRQGGALPELREMDALRKGLLDASLDGIAIIGQDHRIIEANTRFRRMLGYDEQEILGLYTWDYEANFSEQQIREQFADLTTIDIRFETRHKRKDGSIFDVEVSATGRDVGGKAMVIAIVRDISERKKTQRALQEASQRFKAVLDSTTDGFWLVNREGRILEVNDTYCRLSGYTADEIRNMSIDALDNKQNDTDIRQRITSVIDKGNEIFETRHRRKNGSSWPVEVSISYSPVQGGTFFCFLRDISERKAKERELESYQSDLELLIDERTRDIEKQKSAFETLFEKSPYGELVIENGMFVQCNERALEMLGYRDKQQFLPCTPMSISPRIQPDGQSSLEKAQAVIQAAFDGRGNQFDWVHTRSDGQDFWCEVTLTPLALPGRDRLLFVAWRDIGEQKAAEESLQKARDMAESASRLKSEFLANMSHEIRTPMNAVIGMTHLALQSGLDEQQHNYISKAHQAGESLLGILNDILDFSRIEAGKLKIEKSAFDLDELLLRLEHLMKLKADEKHLRFNVEVAPEVPRQLVGATLRIRQVLINLTSNAIKFSPRGGSVDVAVRLVQKSARDATLELSVTDQGIGLTERQQSQLFQPFTQVDSSPTRAFGGAGLGLAISDQLIQAMGGKIEVTSRPGEGSRFSFTLTLALDHDALLAPSGNEDSGFAEDVNESIDALRQASVLLVEDNEINMELAIELLKMHGIQTVAARNGKEALELLEQRAFDGVLMDCQMPVMDGYEATRRIRAMDKYRDLPILAITANTMKGDREKVLQAGMNDHIPKPLDPDTMLAIMARWIKPRS